MTGQRLQDVAFLVSGADSVPALHDHPVVAFVGQVEAGLFEIGIDVPLDLGPVDLRLCAHVDRGHVVGLVEVVEHHLPVAGKPHAVGHRELPGVDVSERPFVPDQTVIFICPNQSNHTNGFNE